MDEVTARRTDALIEFQGNPADFFRNDHGPLTQNHDVPLTVGYQHMLASVSLRKVS